MADLLIEIGTEELPATRVRDAAAALRDGLAARLADAGLLDAVHGSDAPVLGTPRRLAAFLPGIRERQEDREERVWGPPVAAAFDKAGKPTKAGEGFARSVGVDPADLGRGEKVPGKPPYLFADRVVKGRTAAAVIGEALPEVVARLPFKRTMRWPQSDLPFARPIRNLVVLLGEEVVPCTLAGVEAGRRTTGHCFLAPGGFEIPSADLEGYEEALRERKVLVDWHEREQRVRTLVRDSRAGLDADTGESEGRLQQVLNAPLDRELFGEVSGLVEYPTSLVGSFEEKYRDLPPAVLVTAMVHHLRFFPVFTADGQVMSRFVSVTDREESAADGIRAGNERVLRARLYDADFFFRNDRRRPLEAFRKALAGVDFHRGLGTLLDKSERVRRIAATLAKRVGLSESEAESADRAAHLLKCDLVTEVVKEFPELQGETGAEYACRDDEPAGVAEALEAQYWPAGLRLTQAVRKSAVAALVGVAERVDTLTAYFSIGEEPTGSADPYGLRRQALALLDILEQRKEWPISLDDALDPALREWSLGPEAVESLKDFLWGRAVQSARAEGFADFVECVGKLTHRPYPEFRERLGVLQSLASEGIWNDLVALVERTGNMAERSPNDSPPADDLPPEVRAVAEALRRATSKADAGLHGFAHYYLKCLGNPVHKMFEKVLVDDPDRPEQRAAIKGLLYEVHALFADRLGDLRRLGSGAKPPRE